MLVLSRKLNDEIVVGDDVVIRIVKIKGNTVRLGISAPQDVSIMRGELPQRSVEFTLDIDTSQDDDLGQSLVEFKSNLPQATSSNRIAGTTLGMWAAKQQQ